MQDVFQSIVDPYLKRSDLVSVNYDAFKRSRLVSCYTKALNLLSSNDFSSVSLEAKAPVIRSRLSRLDNNVIIDQSTLSKWFKEVKDVAAFEEFLGARLPECGSDFMNPVLVQASLRLSHQLSGELSFRIQEEFSVDTYPVFWTLTLDPEHEHIIAKGRKEFQNWLRKVRKSFGDFTYCCVVERGEQTSRLHYHCLFFFEDLSFCTDPNFASFGKQREIPELRGFWPYGLSNPIAVRFGPRDVYGRLGWRWPKGLSTGSIGQVAGYMSKYVSKSKEELGGCRKKMSRNFGLNRLNQMSLLEASWILQGLQDRYLKSHKFLMKPPKRLMRRCAAKKIYGTGTGHSLPILKVGSIVEAAALVTRRKLVPMSTGSLISRVAVFEELDPCRELPHSVRMGEIL